MRRIFRRTDAAPGRRWERGRACVLNINFAPQQPGTAELTAVVQISGNAPQNPLIIKLSGQPVQAAATVAPAGPLMFGSQLVGDCERGAERDHHEFGHDRNNFDGGDAGDYSRSLGELFRAGKQLQVRIGSRRELHDRCDVCAACGWG